MSCLDKERLCAGVESLLLVMVLRLRHVWCWLEPKTSYENRELFLVVRACEHDPILRSCSHHGLLLGRAALAHDDVVAIRTIPVDHCVVDCIHTRR